MAKRKGDAAKAAVLAKLKEFYPDAIYSDKKLYVMEDDEGELVQIAISLTMPKVMVETGEQIPAVSSSAAAWAVVSTPKKAESAIPSEEEQKTLAELCEKLGITD